MAEAPSPHGISGRTRLLGIAGDPIAQAGSPAILNPRLAAAEADTVLVPLHVPAGHFEEVMRGLMRLGNLTGLILTVPFKERAVPLADRVLDTGREVGAINALRREAGGGWTGDMFDGIGLVRALAGIGQSIAHRRVLLIGAGGAGRAIAMALARAGAVAITISDLLSSRADDLARRVRSFHPACAAAAGAPLAAGHDLIVNATPVGMAPGDGLPAALGGFAPAMVVADIVPRPTVTPLLAAARAAGCHTVAGTAVIEAQADTFLEFFGCLPPAAAGKRAS